MGGKSSKGGGGKEQKKSKEELEKEEQAKIKAYAGDGGKGERRGSVIDEFNLERTKSVNAFDLVVKDEDVETKNGHFYVKLTTTQKEKLWEVYDSKSKGELSMEELKRVMRHLMRFRAKHATESEKQEIELRAVLMTPYSKQDFDELTLAKKVFDSLGINHDGHVTRKDFIEKFDLDAPACQVN
jgi:polyhydroxyalkanoate synthesis regulator phasin